MLTPEEQEVLHVIEASHRAFWLKDVETFCRLNLDSEHYLRWTYWQAGGISLRRGWDEVGPPSVAHMHKLVRPFPEIADAPAQNLRIRVARDMAWASFERVFPHLPGIFGQGPNGAFHSVNILERHGGDWKIAGICLFDAHLGDEVLVEVDTDCRIVWASVPAQHSLVEDDVFVVRAGRLRLRNERFDARLRAAVRAVGTTNDFLMPQRRALPLVFEAGTGLARTVWVLAEGGRNYVMLEDRRPIEERLMQAGVVYDLSPAQLRVAGAVCMGVSLPDFARQAGISLNTARTHLKRIFEKLGVSSQPVLVRALLSLTPPR